MTLPPAGANKPQGKKRFRRAQAILGTLLLVSVIWLGLYLRSNAFRETVRKKVVAELEVVTGGKVELQSLWWNLSRLQFEARGVTIHGREAPDQSPFVQVDRIAGQAKIVSLFRQEIGLRSLVIDHPVIHLIFYPDGSTNQPLPKIQEQDSSSNSGSPAQRLFDLAVNNVEIDSAELLLNDRKIPFDFTGDHLSAGMSYSKAGKAYEGNLSIELTAAHYQRLSPLHGRLELNFTMRPTHLEVKTLKFTMDHSVLEANGAIDNYSHPEVHLQYNASLDLKEVSRITRISELQGGQLELRGTATYQNQEFETQGSLAGHNVGWHESSWELARVEVASPFLLTPDKILFSAMQAKVLGGSAQGELQIVNWKAPSAANSAKKTPLHGSLKLHLAGIQASPLASAISTRRLPLNKINLAGVISGEVSSVWTRPARGAITELKLLVDPPANPTPQQLPVTAIFQGAYHHGARILDITGLSFATRGIRVNATGTLGSSTAQLQLAFNANNLVEVQPVLAAWSSDAQIPVDVHGRASFNGAISGKFNAISARGRLDLQDFDTFLGPIHALVAQNAIRKIHWDSMLADVLLTPSNVTAQNGVLKRGPGQVLFSGSVSLEQGVFDAQTSNFTADLQVQNASLADVQLLAGLNYPITGVLSGTARATGTLSNLHGSGEMNATRLTIYGEPFTRLHSSINFAGPETQFNNLLISHNGAQLTGSAAVNALAGSYRFDLKGSNIELANFSRFAPQRFSLAGRAEFHAMGSGTADSPALNAQLNVHQLVINSEIVGDLTASAETHGEEMLLRANTSFQNAAFNLEGSMRLRENFPVQMTLKFDHLNFGPLIRAYVKAQVTGPSSMQGYIELRGPIKTPRALSVVANISQLSINVQHVQVENDGPLRFSVNNQAIHVDQFHLKGQETDISLRGDAELAGTKTLDVHAEGKLDLKLLQTVDPNLTSSGAATVEVHFAGTIGQPQVRGRMDIANGAISAVDLPNGLTQINGRLVFIQDRLQIENLRAHTGGGDLDLSGFIAYRSGVYFDVTATSNDVRVRYPPGLSASANANLRYTGSAQSSLLFGNATIVRLAVDPRFDFAQYLAHAKTPGKAGSQNPFLENLRLDVHIVSTPELRVETSLAKVSGDADLHIRGTMANPSILGRVNIAEGDVSFNGTKYRLERGDVTFNNPQLIEPIINVEMAGRVRDYDITIGFHGPVDRLNITYRSDPPLPSSDIIALLAFGRTKQEDVYSNQTTTPLTTSDTMLQQALSSASSSRVQKLFGVGSVKIDPQAIDAETNLGPRLTIEQQIQNNITLTYITNVAQSSSEQIIQVEYNLTKSISVVAVRDQNGILAFQIKIKARKK